MKPADFGSSFDRRLAELGPAALFTLDADGELRLADTRSREAHALYAVDGSPPLGWRHCLFRDRETGWVHYVLVTSPALCDRHPRSDIVRFGDQKSAFAVLESLGRPPVWHGPWPRPQGEAGSVAADERGLSRSAGDVDVGL